MNWLNIMPFKIGLAEERKKRLKQELERIMPDIISLDVEKIILFGSLNSGMVNASSDIDLIIVKRTEKKFIDRLDEFYAVIKPRFAIDMLVYTPEELDEMKDSNQFIKFALENGRVLYEK